MGFHNPYPANHILHTLVSSSGQVLLPCLSEFDQSITDPARHECGYLVHNQIYLLAYTGDETGRPTRARHLLLSVMAYKHPLTAARFQPIRRAHF